MAQNFRSHSECSQSTHVATKNDRAKGGKKYILHFQKLNFQSKVSPQRCTYKHNHKSGL